MSVMEIFRQSSNRDYNVRRYAVPEMATSFIWFGLLLRTVAPWRCRTDAETAPL
jgi:hypothetical protein